MGTSRGRDGDVEDIGIIRRTIQDVLVPEMQSTKERLVGHDEKFLSIQQRFDGIDRSFDLIDKRFEQLDQRLERMERRIETLEKRLDAAEKAIVELRVEVHQGFTALRATLDRIEARLSFS